MRTRNEIEKASGPNDPEDTNWVYAENTDLLLEVLLDIRDLLANPPLEITGEPLHAPEESDYQRLMKYGGNGAGGGSAPEVKKEV